jgi:Lon protease-like protein
MNTIPLFPLHTVLFPGMPIRLQIFEDRYLQMVQNCIDQDLPIGIVLIKEGLEALGPLPIPYDMGCLSQIKRVNPQKNGRLNMLAQGSERIEILEVLREGPYLQAVIRARPLRGVKTSGALHLAKLLQPMLARYLVELAALRERQVDPPDLPSHPQRLAYLACSLLQLPPGQKQALLAMADATQLLESLFKIFRIEIPLLRMTHERRIPEMVGPFGHN